MDVKCERCNTEYEFDDALVSGRGTTVKCTNCGHKFKIRRSDGDFSEDFWNVTTGDGRTLVFTSLRELQRAIQGYLVERNDRLSRGGLPPKAIGQIPELAPFFEQREAAKKSQGQRPVKTQDGLGPAATAVAQAAGARPRQATKPEFLAPPSEIPSSQNAPGKTTLIGTGPSSSEEAFSDPSANQTPSGPHAATSAPPTTERQPPRFDATVPMPQQQQQQQQQPPPPVPPGARTQTSGTPPPVPRVRESMNTVPIARPTPPPPPIVTKTQPPPAPAPAPAPAPTQHHPPHVSNPPPLPERARRSSAPIQAATPSFVDDRHDRQSDPHAASHQPPPTPRAHEVSTPLPPPRARTRSLLSEIEEERDRVRGPSASMPDMPPSGKRRSVGGFIVATVVVCCVLMLGAVWAQKNLGITLTGSKPNPTTSTPPIDPRVATFLTNGEKALVDGNLELAKESFDKASALSEKDPHVLLDVARLAAFRADVLWLKSRLLPPDAADEHRITRDGLTENAASARKAADDALSVAPEDPNAFRAKMDALRISGDRDGARALVAKIAPIQSQPESAYALAALDLAEAEPLWPQVIERLRTASSAETGPGRARAALVFALARSGDQVGAKAEVDRLSAMTRPHPLLPLLRTFADHAKGNTKLDAGVDAATVAMDVADAGRAGLHPGTGTGTSGGVGISGDPRELVAQGEKARAKGDYEKARTLFGAAVDKNPNDSEALAGLAAISYAQHDLSGARASYKRVLSINPNYMPALVGLADVEWDSGDKANATKMYKDIIDRYPEGAYPARIKQRVEGG